ncbi:DUF3298 and DUF4163 domain-containing protein [Gillisia sp. M10.2A]|uniref:DUF3298 and DUF4163 domain-containing protein n=1 Tax=Gillisia lutea TaxID=2909668 RepID=A0ABS9ECW9_9FLAO|nr:DUF3298 and DUF4163 domain-containing protein [Gillisia lutea]MCF4100729.1 DUF3298 and DUF4163 domain-containing protein [Gillisia lutea]
MLLPLSIFVMFVGCKNEPAELIFEELAIEQVSEMNCKPEEENCAFISLHTPWVLDPGTLGKEVNYLIEKHIIHLVDFQEEEDFKSLEALSQSFIDNYEQTAKEFPEYNIPWEASVEGVITHNSPELITIKYNLAIFTGGAHGYTSVSYLNINPDNGQRLLNKDLFTEEFEAYAEALFREKNEIGKGESINSTGFFFENDEFQLPQNIGFTKDKLILQYNAYEVASYAEGGIRLEIPMVQATPFLKKR